MTPTPRRRTLGRALALGALAFAVLAAVLVLHARHPHPRAAPRTTTSPAPRPHRRHTPEPLRLPLRVTPRSLAVPILMYHRIAAAHPGEPAITRRLTVAPATFAAQMTWLVRHGYHAVGQAQLFAALEGGTPLPPRPIAITFDDGYRDVLWHAAPVLARLHMPATAYVITGRISGPDPSFLTWPELVRLERFGVAIASHTVTHRELTQETDADALHELEASRRALEEHLRHPVQWFAYPAGAEDPRVVALVRRAGYVLAVTTHAGELQRSTHPFELERYEVLDSTGVAGLASMLGAPG